jgi:hypothetical protein
MIRGTGFLIGVSGRQATVTYEYGLDSRGNLEGILRFKEDEFDAELLSDELSLVTADGNACRIRITEHDNEQAAFIGG